jgi:2-oxoglutarate ferredoxin oxidoreductase subunit alpha
MKARGEDVSLVLCGEAGQGIQTVEDLLTKTLKRSGFHVCAVKEYMSRIRGGHNSITIRVGSRRVAAPVNRIDVLVPLSRGAVAHVAERLDAESIVLADLEALDDIETPGGASLIDVPFLRLAREAGNAMYANTVAAAVLACLFHSDTRVLEELLRERFESKGEEVVNQNITALEKGCLVGRELRESGKVSIDLLPDERIKNEALLNGGLAVGMGAVAGGCSFISSYPMTPSTSVLTFLAQQAERFGIVAEQAEDEIAAINMALGASYAGARAMVTTSGGGFALMTEGVSLAGMLETPLVIHLAQRPGPATGLPTRTEQGDLLFALFAGHGEFPRAVFAPGDPEEALVLTARAFDIAETFQIPVFLLTDQHLVDTYVNIPEPDLAGLSSERHLVRTTPDYRRYLITDSGLSPRGVPGYGDGLVAVDSDEHDEEGHITEDLHLRRRMTEKRLKKYPGDGADILPPRTAGHSDAAILLLSWGSNYPVLCEALQLLERDDLGLLHFSQVWPLPSETGSRLRRAERRILVENNATAQFGQVLAMSTGVTITECILKYDGLPFTVEELAGRISAQLEVGQ